jgi:hypothetical protein
VSAPSGTNCVITDPTLGIRPSLLDHAAFGVILIAFVLLTAFALLTFPPFYEDEPWTYLAVFEALRGNGFTWAAFGEGRPLAGMFMALVTPAIAIIPAAPESAIRIVAATWGLLCLGGAYLLARRWTYATAWVAPALMLGTQYVFVALRYGRTDGMALALTLWSVVAATRQRPLVAGALLGLAVSVHPLFIWAAGPCVWLIGVRNVRSLGWLGLGVGIGVAPQLGWTYVNWQDVGQISRRYAVSSSMAADVSGGIIRSVMQEPTRYLAYVSAQSPWQRVTQALAYVVLPLVGLGHVMTWRLAAGLVMPAILGLAVLAQNKNPYYIYSVLPFVGVVTACAIGGLPGPRRRLAAVAVAAMTVLSVLQFAREGCLARNAITADAATAALADQLPRDAALIAPNLYAGIVKRRPDIAFFNYHALSTRPGWGLPSCEQMPAAIRALVDRDSRGSSIGQSSVAYVVAPSEAALTAYLQQIYVRSTANDAQCLLRGKADLRQLRVCGSSPGPCDTLVVATMQLPDGSAIPR